MRSIQKRWFHATTKEAWKKIKEEGLLWGITDRERQTFLARNLGELIRMINLPFIQDLRKCQIILSVEYVPNGRDDDYNPKSWELIVNKPIPTSNVRLLKKL